MQIGKTTFYKKNRTQRGQVALFIALAFQIIFLFFAMVINVGLLVHHKINLQNSVDLAAYYGAMKQAENMNAIAHINYQIRQSWKLLAWRYRMLGMAGEFQAHPYRKDVLPRAIDPALDIEGLHPTNQNFKNWQIAPPFCISYIPFKDVPKGENTCKAIANQVDTILWRTTPVITAIPGITLAVRNLSETLRLNALNRCKVMGSLNYVMLAKFVVAFNMDQRDRMEMMVALSRGTSKSEDDFYDLDGASVKVGIEKTLLNNLTEANRASLLDGKGSELKVFNSLGAANCNAEGLANGQPAKWLSPVRIIPGFKYVDTLCEGTTVKSVIKGLTNNADDFPRHRDDAGMKDDIENKFAPFVGYRQDLNDNYNFSIGVEKNPWCMAYTGVSATVRPKIPFSPFGTVTLKARAFYKPFGGRMGPWYQSKWPSGSEMSSQGERTDPNLPPRNDGQKDLKTVAEDVENAALRSANYSRFVGDTLGLKSYKMIAHYGKAIFELDAGWRSNSIPNDPNSLYTSDEAPTYDHWRDLPFEFNQPGGKGDVLAWDSKNDRPSAMRVLETAAILPDNFDMAYYSIEPDYYHNYFQRIQNGYLAGPGRGITRVFRPDIGYHKDGKLPPLDFGKFSIKDQYKLLRIPGDVVDTKEIVDKQFTYISKDWTQLLTAWAPKTLSDYSLDISKFGKCSAFPLGAEKPDENEMKDPNPATSGNCVYGGSTGYSVKMVSSDYLRSESLELGGEGMRGPIKNKPPADEDF